MLRMFYTFHNNFHADVEFLNLIFLQFSQFLMCTICGQITDSATSVNARITRCNKQAQSTLRPRLVS